MKIEFTGIPGMILLIVSAVMIVASLLGGFCLLSFVLFEWLIGIAMKWLKVYQRFIQFIWYYNRGLKEKLKEYKD